MGRPRGWSRLYIRNWRIRTKLAAVLLVPSLAFVAVGGLQVFTTYRGARLLDAHTERVRLSHEVGELVHLLQRERDRTAGAVVATDRTKNAGTAVGEFSAAAGSEWRAVNSAVEKYRDTAGPVGRRVGGAFKQRVDAAATSLDELSELRTAAAEGQLRNDAVFDGYGRIIAALLRVLPEADLGAGTGVRGLADLAHAKEFQSQVRGRIQAAAQAGQFTQSDYRVFTELRARRAAALERFRAEAEAGQIDTFENQVRRQPVLAATTLERSIADSANLGVTADEWWSSSSTEADAYRAAERSLADETIRATERYADSATERAALTAALVGAMLLAAFGTSFVIGKSMSRSLRRLRRRALVAAQHDLPDAIRRLNSSEPLPRVRPSTEPLDAADEIGDVATAFDAVHTSAIELATDQAALRRDVSAMFVNLARRSQVLVGRQLALLDELEADEQDPDRLTKFFALDHLATRMRRNDENLLVLAASDSHRLWREPVPLGKVLLGAVAETEQYERILTTGPEDVVVTGHVVPDLLHLLAELLDNATAFSPPDAPVRLTGRIVRGHSGAEAVITVEDTGMGMTQSMLADANARLAEPAGIDVAVSERMGLFVVSRLATRHGMKVELRGAAGGGVTASVRLPNALLAPATAHTRTAPEPTPRLDGDTQPLAALEEPRLDTPARVDDDLADAVTAVFARVTDERAPDTTEPDTSTPDTSTPNGLPQRTPRPAGTETPNGRPAAGPILTGGWWSGDGSGWRAPDTPSVPAPAGTNSAGLPVRVPMATRTANSSQPDPAPADDREVNGLPVAEPDEVSDSLTRFHNGIRRADDEDPAPCNT